MAKTEDTSRSIDPEVAKLVNYVPPPGKPSTGGKLIRELEGSAKAGRNGKVH